MDLRNKPHVYHYLRLQEVILGTLERWVGGLYSFRIHCAEIGSPWADHIIYRMWAANHTFYKQQQQMKTPYLLASLNFKRATFCPGSWDGGGVQ